MTDPFVAGSVWWGLLNFNDGKGETKKYFVLLSDCSADNAQAASALTTSRGAKHYLEILTSPSPCGCPKYSCFRIDKGQEAFFPVTTWVQFNNVGATSRASLVQLEKEGRAGFHGSLAAERFRSILNCAKKAEDLEGWARKLAEKTLKAINPAKQAASNSKQSAVQAPTTSPEIAAVRVRFERRCSECRVEIVDLLSMQEVEVTAVLLGSKPAPDNFVSDAQVAFELARSECSCLTTKPQMLG